jgi:hypothetical protein
MTARRVGLLLLAAILASSLPATATTAQTPDPPCAPGVAPTATIQGFDVEGGDRVLTATHTIVLEARDRDGQIQGVTFTLPPAAKDRTTSSDSAFTVDTPGTVPVGATWSQSVESDGSTCTASAQGTLQIRPAEPLRFVGPPPGRWTGDLFQSMIRTGKRGDLRPVELRLRGVRRARLPGPGARLQTVTIALRKGDAGLSPSRRPSGTLRAAGWKFSIGFVNRDVLIVARIVGDTGQGRRGHSRGFGYAIDLVQAGHRVAHVWVVGRCGYLGCRWRSGR